MDLTNLDDLRLAMRMAGIKPKKGLGQHFLVDQDSLELVMTSADLKPSDTVLEIGPGLGVMTMPLTKRVKQVVVVEADPVFSQLLEQDAPANLTVINADILKFDLTSLPADYKVVANIPYYLTSNLLRVLLESANPPSLMSLLIQREVAERITAGPGQTSLLSLSVQYYANPRLAGVVERHKFWPPPKVDSAVLTLERRTNPIITADPAKLFRLIKAGFGERRKQLKNALTGGLNISDQTASVIFKQAKINPTKRAQELSWPDWERLYRSANSTTLLT